MAGDATTTSSPFERIDDDVVEKLLSFCDFHTAVHLVGRTCRRLKRLSDTALDKWADAALERLTEKPIEYENSNDSGEASTEGVLKRGWSRQYRTKAALIEKALEYCDPGGQVSLEDIAQYEEDTARFLLSTRGRVDVEDFIDHDGDDDDYYAGEVGWNVGIKHGRLSLAMATKFIGTAMNRLDGSVKELGDERDQHVEPVGEVERLRHFTLCLLRKANPSSVHFSSLKADYRHTDYPSGSTDWVVMFILPDHNNTEIEYHFSSSFQRL